MSSDIKHFQNNIKFPGRRYYSTHKTSLYANLALPEFKDYPNVLYHRSEKMSSNHLETEVSKSPKR